MRTSSRLRRRARMGFGSLFPWSPRCGYGSVLALAGAVKRGKGVPRPSKSSTGDLRRKRWRSSSWRERCSCSQSQTQPLPTGGIAGSEATAQSDLDGEETGERSGRQGGAGFVCRAVGSAGASRAHRPAQATNGAARRATDRAAQSQKQPL
ncbi:hypothetical protein GGI35DRAFT_304557 [Trichoderma velutinum]